MFSGLLLPLQTHAVYTHMCNHNVENKTDCNYLNPRHACARVTVIVLCVCACVHSSCFSVHLHGQPMIVTGFF